MSTTDEKAIMLKDAPLFAHLDMDQLHALAAISEEIGYERGAVIATPDEGPNALYVVVEGRVAMQKAEITRRQQENIRRLATFGPNDCFGELSVFDGEPFAGDMVAMRATKLLALRQAPLLALIEARPALALNLLKAFCHQMRNLMAAAGESTAGKPKKLMDLYDLFE